MSDCQYRNFDVTIRGAHAPYSTTAAYRGLSAQGTFDHDAAQPVWQEYTAILGDLRRMPGEGLLTEMGSLLFNALLRDEIRELWQQACNDADEIDASNVRLRLLLHPPAVAALPWESLYDPRRQRALGADPLISLVRLANRVGYMARARPIAAQLPVKILVAAVDDIDDVAGLDIAGEIAGIKRVLASLQPHKVALHTVAGPLDIHALRRHLIELQPDIFHLISHGTPDGLLLWTADGQPDLVSGRQIQAMLRQFTSLKLILLNACLAGLPDHDTPFANVAERLLQTGLPAVIAMQFAIADRAAVDFAGFLYEALVSRECFGAVDRAVGIARSNLYVSHPNQIDYITPILWLNAEDGLIFQLIDQERSVQEASAGAPAIPVVRQPDAIPTLDPQIAEKDRWLATLPRYNRTRLGFDARVVHDARQNDIKEATYWLDRLRTLDREQAEGQLRFAQIQDVLKKFEVERKKIQRATQLLLDHVGPGEL